MTNNGHFLNPLINMFAKKAKSAPQGGIFVGVKMEVSAYEEIFRRERIFPQGKLSE
jgi:hypothetical protein